MLRIIKACVLGLLIFSLGMGMASASKKMMFVTGPSTGGWYPTGAAMGEIIMNGCPDLNITVTEGGGVGNVRDVNANRAQIGYTFSNVFAEALSKRKPFDKEDINQVAGFLTLYTSHLQAAVHADSDIQSYADLKGKRIAPGRKTGRVKFLCSVFLMHTVYHMMKSEKTAVRLVLLDFLI